jgi:hypothetical protein
MQLFHLQRLIDSSSLSKRVCASKWQDLKRCFTSVVTSYAVHATDLLPGGSRTLGGDRVCALRTRFVFCSEFLF